MAWGAGTEQARQGLSFFESVCKKRFPGWIIRWAFTSSLYRERSGMQKRKADSASKALMKLYYEKFDQVAVQPLQIIPGRENEEVRDVIEEVRGRVNLACVMGEPLLGAKKDEMAIAKALAAFVPSARQPGEPVVYMGHGGKNEASAQYSQMASIVAQIDPHIYIGTLGGDLSLAKLLPRLPRQKVWLLPFFATIGRHAMKDMAGENEDSWRGQIAASGRECQPVLRGLAASEALTHIWLNHLEAAIAGFSRG